MEVVQDGTEILRGWAQMKVKVVGDGWGGNYIRGDGCSHAGL